MIVVIGAIRLKDGALSSKTGSHVYQFRSKNKVPVIYSEEGLTENVLGK